MAKVLILSIRAYQYLISPLIPPSCRFYPSCSHYAAQAIRDRGLLTGLWLTLLRLLKCHPLHPGCFDPLPRKTRALPRRQPDVTA